MSKRSPEHGIKTGALCITGFSVAALIWNADLLAHCASSSREISSCEMRHIVGVISAIVGIVSGVATVILTYLISPD